MSLFPGVEYLNRLAKTKEQMGSKGIDVLILTDPANMNYLSGYDGWSFYVHQMLIVFIDEEMPYWVGRYMDANGARHTAFLDEAHIVPYPDTYVQSFERHPMDFVADFLKDKNCGSKRIGVEKDAYYFTALSLERLAAGLPDAHLVDATLLVNYVRLIKSNLEIDLMRKAGVIASKAMRTALEAVEVGARQCDVAAQIYQAQISGTEEFGGDYPSIVPLMASGERTSAPHLTWSDERYQLGETIIFELAGCVRRYHSPLSRTVTLGEPDPKVSYLAEVVVEGLNTALEMVKPGVVLEEVEAAWRNVIGKYGFEKEARIGYAMGLNYPPDWGEHTASIRSWDKTILVPNMTFHMIPGMWMDNYGVEISEAFRVTETGYEVFADVPRELLVKPHLTLRGA